MLSALRAIQSSDGGFPFVAAKGQASDPELDRARDPGAPRREQRARLGARGRRERRRRTPRWPSYQLGCTSPDFGAFIFPGSTTANVFATVQSVPAMAGKKLPGRVVDQVGRARTDPVLIVGKTVPTDDGEHARRRLTCTGHRRGDRDRSRSPRRRRAPARRRGRRAPRPRASP